VAAAVGEWRPELVLKKNIYSTTYRATDEELALFKTHLFNRPPAPLWHLKKEINTEKRRREAEITSKAPEMDKRPSGLGGRRLTYPAGEEPAPTKKACK
jgi:hypothetical protein